MRSETEWSGKSPWCRKEKPVGRPAEFHFGKMIWRAGYSWGNGRVSIITDYFLLIWGKHCCLNLLLTHSFITGSQHQSKLSRNRHISWKAIEYYWFLLFARTSQSMGSRAMNRCNSGWFKHTACFKSLYKVQWKPKGLMWPERGDTSSIQLVFL